MVVMRTALTAAVVLTLAALVAPASAQAPDGLTITLSPNTTASGATLTARVDGSKLDKTQQAKPPRRVLIASPAGMRFDPRAVGATCNARQAAAHTCPAASKVGSGSAVVSVKLFGIPREVTATLTGYLGTARKGDLAGLIIDGRVSGQRMTSSGRILRATSTRGPAVLFDFPDVDVPAGISATLKSLMLSAGAQRDEKVRDKSTGRTRTVRHHLLTTPKACKRTWTASSTLTFASGPVTVTVPIACRV